MVTWWHECDSGQQPSIQAIYIFGRGNEFSGNTVWDTRGESMKLSSAPESTMVWRDRVSLFQRSSLEPLRLLVALSFNMLGQEERKWPLCPKEIQRRALGRCCHSAGVRFALPSCMGSSRPIGGAVTGGGALVDRVTGVLLGQDDGRVWELKDLWQPNFSLHRSLSLLSNPWQLTHL